MDSITKRRTNPKQFSALFKTVALVTMPTPSDMRAAELNLNRPMRTMMYGHMDKGMYCCVNQLGEKKPPAYS